MIGELITVIAPVFLMLGCGFFSARSGLMQRDAVDGLMRFAQGFAIPCLLLKSVAELNLSEAFELRLLLSFFGGAICCFAIGIFLSRVVFGRRPGESVVVGFGALFSNSVLLGLPITERAFGADALAGNYAIVSIHSPVCYLLGVLVMELSRADGRPLASSLLDAGKSLARNPLMTGIALGFLLNFSGIQLWPAVQSCLDWSARAALPVSLFGLGAVLTRYRLSQNYREPLMVLALSLFIHPLITWCLCTQVFDLSLEFTRSAVLTAAMAPGVNAYLFAHMYNRAQDVAANTVLLGTGLTVVTASAWLWLLGGV